jgi:hypothetical protein
MPRTKRESSPAPNRKVKTQLWSLVGVEAVLNAPGLSQESRGYVERLHSRFRRNPEHKEGDTLTLEVSYHRSKHGRGRRFESGGLQGAPGVIRRLCGFKYYTDWDIANAYPVILQSKMKAAGIPCPILSLYVRNRETCLSAAIVALGVNRTVAKELFIIALHGGNWQKAEGVPKDVSHRQLDQFTAEIRAAAPMLAALPEYKDIWDIVQNDPKKKNKVGSFVSLVCQVTEDAAIEAAEQYLEQVGRRVDVLCFDGVMPRNTDQGPAIDPAEMSRHVSEATGVPLTMIEKPFALLPSDLAVLHPADAQRVLDQSGLNAETKRWLVESMGEPIVLEPAARHAIPEEITEEHDDEFVQRYQFRSDQQMMLIGASMGLGKTHQLREYLKLNPHLKRVLIITARQQQAYSAKGVYADVTWTDCMHGFHMYLDHPSGSLCGLDKLVVQYESLHRLLNFEGVIESYDLIIIDEARSVLGQAQCAVTNQDRLLLNYEIAECLLRECKSILMDADMEVDAAVWDFVSQHLPQERIRFHRYTHVAFRREIIVVSEPEWLRMAAEDLANGKKIGLPFRSKVKMNDVLAMEEFQRHHAIKFDSDSSKDHMEKLLEIDRNLEDVDMMAFTSKITAGADIQTNFEAVYVHGTAASGPTPRDTLQMIGRFRKVTSNRVVCVLPDVRDAALEVNYESEKDTILKRKDLAIHQQQVLAARGMVRTGTELRFLPHPLVGLTAHARVESNYCFSTAFLNQVRRKGWRINLHIPVSDSEEERDIMSASIQVTSTERKQDQEEYRLDVAEKVQQMTSEERKVESERLRALDAAHELDADERVMKNTLHVAIRLPPDRMQTIDSETLSFAAADISAVYLVSTVIRHVREEQDITDATALATAPSGEHAQFRGTGARAIVAVLRLMGFNGPSDTVSRARLALLSPSRRLALVEKCREVFQLLNQRIPRVKESTQKHVTLARNVLRLLRVNFKSQRVGQGTNRVREYRIAEECEGFLELVTDFNPYSRGPPTASGVPYGRHTRAMHVPTSKAVKGISGRERSLVDPLPITIPSVVPGFVTHRIAGLATPMQQGTCSVRVQEVSAAPSDADLAEFQSELRDGDDCDNTIIDGLGCYEDGIEEMQDDSDCMADYGP